MMQTMTVPAAELVAMQDSRADALRVLEGVKARIEGEAATNDLLRDATREALLALQEATERLSTWCPQLFGPGAPAVDETCTCWRCGYCDEVDPFEGRDDPG
jgi:hypothetical protein